MKNKLHLIVWLLIALLLPSCASGISRDEYQNISSLLLEIQEQNKLLEVKITSLYEQLEKMQQDFDSLSEHYLTLQSERDNLKLEITALNSQLTLLQSEESSTSPTLTTPPAPSPPPPTPSTSTPNLSITPELHEGQHLVAQDGTYLGILDSEFASKSVFNDFGEYGSEFSSTSIWNDFSEYGSMFSSLSAFNDLASEPPMLYDEETFICYVTTNTFISPRISPFSLIVFAESMGWK